MYALFRTRRLLGSVPALIALVLIALGIQSQPLKIQPQYDESAVELALVEPEPEVVPEPVVEQEPPPPVIEDEEAEPAPPPPPPKPLPKPEPTPKPKPVPKPVVAKPTPTPPPVAAKPAPAAVAQAADQGQEFLVIPETAADIPCACAYIPEIPEGVPFAVPVTQFPCDLQPGFMAFDRPAAVPEDGVAASERGQRVLLL